MHKQTTRNKSTGRGVLKDDFKKIKAVLAMTAKDMRGQAKHALSESYENMKDKSLDVRENVADYVSSKPLKSMLAASFLGLAFGLAMRRKRHLNGRARR